MVSSINAINHVIEQQLATINENGGVKLHELYNIACFKYKATKVVYGKDQPEEELLTLRANILRLKEAISIYKPKQKIEYLGQSLTQLETNKEQSFRR